MEQAEMGSLFDTADSLDGFDDDMEDGADDDLEESIAAFLSEGFEDESSA
jgi:hypothetical protein